MHTGDRIPLVTAHAALREVLIEMTSKGLGMAGVIDADGRLCGIFTDGDLRRALNRGVDIYTAVVADVMTHDPKTTTTTHLAAELVALLRAHNISGVFVVDADRRVVGALNMHDLLRAGVV